MIPKYRNQNVVFAKNPSSDLPKLTHFFITQKKKKYLLTCWIFFTFQWNHCYFMWVLLDSKIEAMQRMFENEKQVLFLFSSLFHVIKWVHAGISSFIHEKYDSTWNFLERKFIHILKTALYIHKIQRHEKFNLPCHKVLSFLFYFLYFNS